MNPKLLYFFSEFKEQVDKSLIRERLMTTLSGLFGVLAVLLAIIGLYGLISYTLARRANEIGIRVALGARPYDVVKLVLRETTLLVAAGLGAGIIVSLGAGRAAAGLLFGLQPNDRSTLAVACDARRPGARGKLRAGTPSGLCRSGHRTAPGVNVGSYCGQHFLRSRESHCRQ
jgi:ABC-type antimicrobial peptide transport system permease subunit